MAKAAYIFKYLYNMSNLCCFPVSHVSETTAKNRVGRVCLAFNSFFILRTNLIQQAPIFAYQRCISLWARETAGRKLSCKVTWCARRNLINQMKSWAASACTRRKKRRIRRLINYTPSLSSSPVYVCESRFLFRRHSHTIITNKFQRRD